LWQVGIFKFCTIAARCNSSRAPGVTSALPRLPHRGFDLEPDMPAGTR
jgi:hypothetical protein